MPLRDHFRAPLNHHSSAEAGVAALVAALLAHHIRIEKLVRFQAQVAQLLVTQHCGRLALVAELSQQSL